LKYLILCCSLCILSSSVCSGAQSDHHYHDALQVPTAAKLPTLFISLARDEVSGFNLSIDVTNFTLEPPELADATNSAMVEGHAHIYINGEKIYRAYGRYIHLPESLFSEGEQTITVTLNSHQHNAWAVGHKRIKSTLVIDLDKPNFLVDSEQEFQ
jgi:hypothetical protein